MDFRTMKRKELQVLCKKNKIPANLTNLEMARRLTELFQEEKSSSRGWIKGQDEDKSGTESNVVLHREAKKVRFRAENELIEFTSSIEKKRRSNRSSALGDNSLSVENGDKASWRKGKVDSTVKVTRLKGKFSVNGVLNGSNRGRNKVNSNSALGIQMTPKETIDGIAVGTRRSLRNRGVVDEEKLDSDSGVTAKNDKERTEQVVNTTEANVVVTRQNLSRQSKRKSKIVDDSEVFKRDKEKHESDSRMCLRNTTKSVVVVGFEAEVESAGAKDGVHGTNEADCQVDERMKMELRRSSRRQSEISLHYKSGKDNFTVVNGKYSSKTSVLHSETSIVSENEKVIQPNVVRTRSRHKTLSLKAISTKGKLDIDAVAHNSETAQQIIESAAQEKLKISSRNPIKNKSLQVIDELGENVVIQQKNHARKRTRGHISGENFVKPKNDTRPKTRSKRTQRNEKILSAGIVDDFVDLIKLSNSLKEPNILENSSHKGLLGMGESLHKEAELFMAHIAEGSNNTSAKNLSGLSSIRKHHRKDKEASAAIASGRKSINVGESIHLAEDPASEISDLQTDTAQSELGISLSKLMDAGAVPLLLKVSEQEIVGKTISDDNNSKPVVQVFSQSETLSHEIIAGNQEIHEASNRPGNMGPETSFSADGLALVIKGRTDDEVQSNSLLLDHLQIKDISAEENLETCEPIKEITLPTGCHVEGLNLLEASNTVDMGQNMGEDGASEPYEGSINFTDSMSALEMKEPSSGKLRLIHESEHMAKGAKFLVTNDIHSESEEAGDARNIKDLKLESDDNLELGVAILFDPEKRSVLTNLQDREMCSGEYYCEDSDKEEIFHEFPVEAPASMLANSTRDERSISLEVFQVGEGDEINVHDHAHSILAETKEGGCIKDHMRVTDKDNGLSVSAPFDCQRSAHIMPQGSASCSFECSIEEFDGQGTFHGSQGAASTAMPAKFTNNKITTGSSSLLEVNWSTASKSEGSHATIFATCQIIEKEASVNNNVEEKEANSSGNEITGDEKYLADQISNGDYEIYNQAFESSNIGKCDPEQLKSPLAEPIATPNTSKCQESLSSISKTAGHAMFIFKTSSKAEVSEQAVDENANDAESNKEKDDFADAQTLDVPISMGGAIHKMNFEKQGEWKFQDIGETENLLPNPTAHESSNLDEFTDCHSWQEIDLNNLFGSPVDGVTNVTMSLTKSTAEKSHGNLSEKKHELEEVSEWDDYTTIDKRSTWPTTSKEEDDTGSHVGKEEYQLQFLFATPVKVDTLCNVDETTAYEKHAERRADEFFVECIGATKEIEVTQTKSNEKVEASGNETENYLGLGNLLLANGEDIRNPEINDVEVANVCSYAVSSEAKYDGNDESWTENIGENVREPDSLTKENVVDIRNEEVNKDVGSQVAKTYSSTILFEAKYDGNEERSIENTSEFMKESNYISENEVDIRVEGVNEVESVEMENSFPTTILSDAELDYEEKQWIDDTGECTERSNSVTEENENDNRKEEVIEIEFEFENIFSCAVSSEAKYDAYEEQCTKNTDECIEESNSLNEKHEEENIGSLGQSFLDEETTDYDSKRSYENIISPGVKNLCAGKGSAEMLFDCNLSESLSYGDTGYIKYEGEITRSSGVEPGRTDKDIKEDTVVEDGHFFVKCHKGNRVLKESSVDTLNKHLNPEVVNMDSFNGDADVVINKDSSPCILPEAPHENEEVIESKDLEMRTDEADDHITSSHEFLDEQHNNSGMASSKNHFDGYTLDKNVLSDNDGIQKTCEETDIHHHTVHNMVTTAGHECTFFGDEPDMLQSLATHQFVGENECGNTRKPIIETSTVNMEGNQEVDDGGVPHQFFMPEFHLEEKVEDLKSDIPTVSDSSAYECSYEILEESHLANTIKEYSAAVVDDSGANNLDTDLDELQRGTYERVAYNDDKDAKPPAATVSKEPEEPMLFLEPDEGSAMDETLVGQEELNIKDDHITAAKKNARTILIHGTPNKVFPTGSMKENAPNTKRSQIGDCTTVRPTKRRALQDIKWK